MTETERYQIKGALFKCAKENENRPTFTGHIVVLSLCKSAVERIEELEKENGKLEGFLEDERMEYYELENFKNNEIKELKDKTKKIIEYLLDYPYHAKEVDFMQHIKETKDFLKELEND